ncbi:MAG: saccharopine dehydrogenase NADP-binding domain-containing protein [Thermoleophilaceae bacterium]|nr:saccharopine dehydrogenase NADP-binding domain-containing protein [Thermoleophilaceae bacterium]
MHLLAHGAKTRRRERGAADGRSLPGVVETGARLYDIVLFGATGFTGGLTAEYLARHAPPECRWALAGRNRKKLERLRERLAEIEPSRAGLPLLHADVDDVGSLRDVAECTRVVTTTVGPYITYGEPLVAACAAAGTDYTDLTGEPEFVDLMYVNHHREATETGARMVHACGFDSVPHDLGALFTVEQLPEGEPIDLRGFVTAGGKLSAGTLRSAITGFSRVRGMSRVAAQRRRLEQRPADRIVRGNKALPYRDSGLGAWALPLPTIDPQIVLRSARALERYGPEFTYGHFAAVKRLPAAVAGVGGVGGLLALAQLPPARDWLLGRMKSGEGPSARQREKGWFKVRFRGEGGGRRVETEVSGGDPGYGETSKMLAECALCLAHDDLPETSGQTTTAVAMGHPLTARLERAGISFKTLAPGP